jgi:DNA modification methylase
MALMLQNILNKVAHSDALKFAEKLPDKSVDCVITSPPYFQLRDYGFDGQWGLEKTYNNYLDNLILLTIELKRVLKDTGTMFINLGDSYATNSGSMGTDSMQPKFSEAANKSLNFKQNKGMPEKCLMLIPHRFALRCIDEIGLILRNDIIWAKRNGMPEPHEDRFSKKHEFIFFFVKQQNYYFDLNAIRAPHKLQSIKRAARAHNGYDKAGNPYSFNPKQKYLGYDNLNDKLSQGGLRMCNKEGKNPGDVSDFWDIPTKGNNENHYASFNFSLIDKPIIAGCPPRRGCIRSICRDRHNINSRNSIRAARNWLRWERRISIERNKTH